MSNLVYTIVLALLLLNASASVLGHPPAPPQPQPQEESQQSEETTVPKQTPEAQSEEGEGAEGPDGDNEKGPKKQPGLLPLEPLVQVDLGARPVGPALLFEDSLIVVTEAGTVMRLDSKTGELRWKLGLPGSKLLPPSLVSETLLIVDRSGTLFLVDPATGTVAKELSTGIAPSLPPISQESVVFLATADSVIIAFDVEKTQEIWRAAVQDTPLAIAVGGDLLVVSDRAGALHALDSKLGLMRWQFQGRGTFPAPGVFDSKNERFFIGDTRGFFYSLAARNGKVHYRWGTGAAIPLSPLVEEERVYVATYANTLFCYRPWNGHELWRANLPGRPAASPERARRRIVVVTLDGQVAEYGSGGTKDSPVYTMPAEILPAPTLTPGGLAVPLRSGNLLLLQTKAPTPKIEPGEEGELGGETPTSETQPTPGPITPQ
jgi:outer membrane protein assembly factor BamB